MGNAGLSDCMSKLCGERIERNGQYMVKASGKHTCHVISGNEGGA